MFAGIGNIPGGQGFELKLGLSEGRKGFKFAFRLGLGPVRQILQEAKNRVGISGHAIHQLALGIVLKAKQLSEALAKAKNLHHHGRVIPLAVPLPQFRCSRYPCFVEAFPEGPVFGVGHHRQIGRGVQQKAPDPCLAPLSEGPLADILR